MSEQPERVGRSVRLIGFWASTENDGLPNPAELVDESWELSYRGFVANYLDSGQLAATWMGFSRCRLCSQPNGSRDLTDGYYLWPQGLSHYVVDHAVRLPAEFLAHVEQQVDVLDELDRDVSWWLENAHRA